jgi:TPP-dependent indolepyruvate ferredoxin oxidoreductase alpha subunit
MGIYHSGIIGLIQVVRDQIPVITVILDNGICLTTGGQPHPGADPGPGQRMVPLVDLVRGAGINLIETINSKDARSDVLRPLLQRFAEARRPGVIILHDRN